MKRKEIEPMNADEIVKRLREYASRCDGTHSCWHAPTLNVAADLIESQAAENAAYRAENERLAADLKDMRDQNQTISVACNRGGVQQVIILPFRVLKEIAQIAEVWC